MKIELHTHSSFSPCGRLSASELISLYCAKKYDAIVLTNHFSRYAAHRYAELGGKDFHRDYHDAIRQAKEIGARNNLIVLAGYELKFEENSNDYLVFGMPEEFTRDFNSIFAMGVKKFSAAAKENGFLLYQAHPFRNDMTVINPEFLFGIEVQNTHPNHDSRNEIALAWAKKYDLHKICGSDCHEKDHAGTSAIITNEKVRNMDDLVHVLKDDRYTMICEQK